MPEQTECAHDVNIAVARADHTPLTPNGGAAGGESAQRMQVRTAIEYPDSDRVFLLEDGCNDDGSAQVASSAGQD